ncbi:MAG: UDP-N-acetylglucosamine 2-epimerase (non-hydrolyzing) [Candidatus Eremiobacteraeota bacterium]|nr:UDP-N-acetylglucosamine 2-epimerase (non-hydrolyzing) [Candidatus Eremiobacteraeota bacterium]MBV9055663.1 UDP-N-acetylglucosamine 2-epimerase (non-hydrolyzing) [Candidatus Eremiobacteraeota bacterium]MBV9700301.1 UDP-N-acetylglucosamine 2-epimerase (non-hydrolyzing) [Candidatus Eremiobacteraeota bacterium]
MSDRLRVMSVFGTRPDTIKMAPVVAALRDDPGIEDIVCVSAQHRQMLDDLLALFSIAPDYDLDVMTEDQTLTQITTRVLTRMESVLEDARPDAVLVHGDTTTSSAAALAAFYAHVPVGHVEAGLRTGNRWLPYPEEMNRRLTGALASYHFAPTELARGRLLDENVCGDDIIVTGNTVIDAFAQTAGRRDLPLPPHWAALDLNAPVVLVTAHRRENHAHMSQICEALRAIVELPQRPQLYWPVHPSPRVAPVARDVLDGVPGVILVDPIDYAQMVAAVKACTFVLTDSGGLQEEAPCLGKPVLVMRDETERPEGLAAGTLELVGHRPERIVAAAQRLLTDTTAYAAMAQAVNPYGDGHASARIARWLLARLRDGAYPEPFAA